MSKQPRVIAFCGTNGAGKDYVAKIIANYLVEQGATTTFYSFAQEVKEICCVLEGTDISSYTIPHRKNNYVLGMQLTRRELMEEVTNLGYKLSPTFWFDKWDKFVANFVADVVFVTDFRYLVSLDHIRKYNGTLVYIKNVLEEAKLSSSEFTKVQELASLADYTITNYKGKTASMLLEDYVNLERPYF